MHINFVGNANYFLNNSALWFAFQRHWASIICIALSYVCENANLFSIVSLICVNFNVVMFIINLFWDSLKWSKIYSCNGNLPLIRVLYFSRGFQNYRRILSKAVHVWLIQTCNARYKYPVQQVFLNQKLNNWVNT